MTEREIQVVNLLVERNVDLEDSAVCGEINCYKVSCNDCPLNTEVSTLGEVRAMKDSKAQNVEDDGVKQPSHYQLFEGVEAIEVIARSMTQEMFKGVLPREYPQVSPSCREEVRAGYLREGHGEGHFLSGAVYQTQGSVL